MIVANNVNALVIEMIVIMKCVLEARLSYSTLCLCDPLDFKVLIHAKILLCLVFFPCFYKVWKRIDTNFLGSRLSHLPTFQLMYRILSLFSLYAFIWQSIFFVIDFGKLRRFLFLLLKLLHYVD